MHGCVGLFEDYLQEPCTVCGQKTIKVCEKHLVCDSCHTTVALTAEEQAYFANTKLVVSLRE